MIELRAVTKTYRKGAEVVHALHGVTLQIRPGDSVALIGPSGAGKSTLLSMLGLMDRPSEGAIFVDGQDTALLSDAHVSRLRGRRIGFVFQAFNLLPGLTAWQNVALPLRYAGVAVAEGRERALAVLERVGLADRAHHRPAELSGGQEQRVAIARALVTNPGVILADEPTGNLDAKTGAGVLECLLEARASGAALVLVTHSPEVASRADQMCMVRDGRMIQTKRALS